MEQFVHILFTHAFVVNFSLYELGLPEADPVYTLKKVMEELDYSGLLSRYSDKGRKGYNPIMLYAVVTYANMRGDPRSGPDR